MHCTSRCPLCSQQLEAPPLCYAQCPPPPHYHTKPSLTQTPVVSWHLGLFANDNHKLTLNQNMCFARPIFFPTLEQEEVFAIIRNRQTLIKTLILSLLITLNNICYSWLVLLHMSLTDAHWVTAPGLLCAREMWTWRWSVKHEYWSFVLKGVTLTWEMYKWVIQMEKGFKIYIYFFCFSHWGSTQLG